MYSTKDRRMDAAPTYAFKQTRSVNLPLYPSITLGYHFISKYPGLSIIKDVNTATQIHLKMCDVRICPSYRPSRFWIEHALILLVKQFYRYEFDAQHYEIVKSRKFHSKVQSMHRQIRRTLAQYLRLTEKLLRILYTVQSIRMRNAHQFQKIYLRKKMHTFGKIVKLFATNINVDCSTPPELPRPFTNFIYSACEL